MAPDRLSEYPRADTSVVQLDPPQLTSATEVLATLAKARPGLTLEKKLHSVLLRYDAAPAAEAAILEAAERLASGGGLTLVRHPFAVELAADGGVAPAVASEPQAPSL